jgi:hypothetical protein
LPTGAPCGITNHGQETATLEILDSAQDRVPAQARFGFEPFKRRPRALVGGAASVTDNESYEFGVWAQKCRWRRNYQLSPLE